MASSGTASTAPIYFTNYKGMGATHMQSLKVNQGQTPLYEPAVAGIHPDGAMSPATASFSGNRQADLADGTTHTILCAETIDNVGSVWTYGTDVTLVGLPTTGDGATNPAGGTTGSAISSIVNTSYPYYYPAGYNGQFDANGALQAFRTFLAFNFAPSAADANSYPTFGMTPYAIYGPSAGHPTTINHLMGDGSVQAINKKADVAAYMFSITKNGGDPNYSWQK